MANEKYAQLIKKLVQATSAGTIQWEPTATEEVYQAAFPSYGVRIWRDRQNEGEDIVLSIINSDGYSIDEVRDSSFAGRELGPQQPYRVMLDLFQAARRRALGAEQAIDSILKDIDDLPPF